MSRGINMVGKKSKTERGENKINPNPRFNNSIQCSKNGGLVVGLPGTNKRRSAKPGGEESTYQHPLVEGSQIGIMSFTRLKAAKAVHI